MSFPHVFSGNPQFYVLDSCLRRNDKLQFQWQFQKNFYGNTVVSIYHLTAVTPKARGTR
jgi:hypothetical protein